ncbi:uncharacterized protein N7500_005719 [Penicillium coprophilum]|uniref:uncharacterized protein n=1 Tax=Penicillium coprophilum TaxID=36646 RepID=UPI002397DA00|nr:uncharacterized protein N7500_005719 [Penicillium coprophilum]KAJ5163889.1 hypothetical protein N7500_005719 [Penicillium coprophilum]
MAGSSPDRHNFPHQHSLFSLSSPFFFLLYIQRYSLYFTSWASTQQSGKLSHSLMGSGQFDKAGILAADFSGVEAASPGFALSQEEINSLITAYTSSDQAFANGFSVCGEKFVTIRADERSVYGKKGKEGVIVSRASSCTIIAHHNESVQTPNAATVVENLVDYLNNPR